MKRRLAALAFVGCVLAAGCGPATEQDSRPIDPADVPFGLLEQDRSGSATSGDGARRLQDPSR